MLCQTKESQSAFERSNDLDVAAAVVTVVAVFREDMEAR